jgi:hypothetical protein
MFIFVSNVGDEGKPTTWPYTNISATSRKVAMQDDRVTTMTNRVSQDSVAISEIKSIYSLVNNPLPKRLKPIWHQEDVHDAKGHSPLTTL